ncbi:hypothetical protein Lesp02_04020 [Lentzea sp. NBRC 105346]|uniref:hypothetical protein n=1 Tax=Lentzea sp. NBRC 105346 TaxID=3032205 RepID=UPI0024A2AF17|nr:hypothetical protein [Lentzea sp. NBRC 105346]GLZ28212.1 hypothetical protein Lesp02_04020 [Lentzea sp. NBRC 105346]
MNITPTMRTQLSSLRELSDAKAQYEELHGWRTSVDVGHQRLVLPVGEEMDAVTMPLRLAEAAAVHLRIAMLAGPMMAAPGGQWLTFLTAPATASRPDLPVELRRARVQLVPRGGQVVIPTSSEAGHDLRVWRWVEPPQPRRALPPWPAVIAAARRAVSGDQLGGASS